MSNRTSLAVHRHAAPKVVDRIHAIAREKFGYADLRPGQEQTIRHVLDGHDVLSIMPTGSGKSAVYQIAGLLTDGPVVVVSPLLALQKDQVDGINGRHVAEAALVNSRGGRGTRWGRWETGR